VIATLAPTLLASLLALPLASGADTQWVLEKSTLTYHVSHPLHESEGVSHAARGKGICHAGECDFLIAVPVKSFDSGDTNRDLHMIQVTRGGEFPMISVRTRLPEAAEGTRTIHADLQVEFAGHTVTYRQVPFEQTAQDGARKITGTIPATLAAFRIDPPTLFTIPVRNDTPVRVEMTWRKQP
jgi:hypothetical protein